MLTNRKQLLLIVILGLSAYAGLFWSTSKPLVAAEEIPQQLSDQAFWKLATDFSETGGYFRSDNFVSNELTFQWVIPRLKRNTKPAGVYLGVGPDQNFTYIVALQPKIAFIFDIRRQNMMLHLMYKALIETSTDRIDFASRLFSRTRPADLEATAGPEELFAALNAVASENSLFETNLKAILDRLEKHHGFSLSTDDTQTIKLVYKAFFEAGPQITYSFSNFGGGRRRMPTYEELTKQDDDQGVNHGSMANEQNFQTLKRFHEKNLIVPLVGDFSVDKAIRAVGKYLKEHDATVTAFYLSNVEQYLFQDADNWRKFYSNVAALPLDSTSTFIRSVFNGMGGVGYTSSGAMRSLNMLSSMTDLVRAFNEGQINGYYDVIRMSR